MDGHFTVVMGVSFKPSYMLANPNLINGEISWLFVAYMESFLVWAREDYVNLFEKFLYLPEHFPHNRLLSVVFFLLTPVNLF